MATIVLDPGHGGTQPIGGSDPNHAKGPSGLLEKTITLDIAKRVKTRLDGNGHTVVLTRSTDRNLSLADRAGVAKRLQAPVFVSIHFNGFDGRTQGTETFCHTTHSAKSAVLCRSVQKGAVGATGLMDRNSGAPGGVKTQTLGVLKPSSHDSNTACVLVEVSFMDVLAEDARLNTEPYKDKVADGLVSGIGDYLQANPAPAAQIAAAELEDGFEVLNLALTKPKKSSARKSSARKSSARKSSRKGSSRKKSPRKKPS
jgi:N-acetylmuramoyl-L-alanine amidase